jgi:N-acetylneuraminate synthase/N,N'-diacetyllegionaminate synthase
MNAMTQKHDSADDAARQKAPTRIIAEIGINHNGDMNLAVESIKAAKLAGADAVKFQNYHTEDFLNDGRLQYTYLSRGQKMTESQFVLFKRCELTDDQVFMLAKICREEKILFFSTPTNEEGIRILQQARAAWLKNGSDFLTHLPLIRAMARAGIPTGLSPGMATLAEIDDAVRAFREAGGENLTLLHCTSSYPTPPKDTHLRKIPALREAFGCPVGFSDHTEGATAAVASVVLGACMIEKHFTLDKNLPGPDHGFSADPEELRSLIAAVRAVEKQLGASAIGPTEKELQNRERCTLSCAASQYLPAGSALTADDIVFRRPGGGLRPKYSIWLHGKTLARAIAAGHVFSTEDFQ